MINTLLYSRLLLLLMFINYYSISALYKGMILFFLKSLKLLFHTFFILDPENLTHIIILAFFTTMQFYLSIQAPYSYYHFFFFLLAILYTLVFIFDQVNMVFIFLLIVIAYLIILVLLASLIILSLIFKFCRLIF